MKFLNHEFGYMVEANNGFGVLFACLCVGVFLNKFPHLLILWLRWQGIRFKDHQWMGNYVWSKTITKTNCTRYFSISLLRKMIEDFLVGFPPVIASREQPCVEVQCLFSIYEDLPFRERQAFVGSYVLPLKTKLWPSMMCSRAKQTVYTTFPYFYGKAFLMWR